MEIDRVNTLASKMIIFGWLAGLAYYNWFSSNPISVPIWAHAVLVVGGMFFASIVIGAGLALLAGVVTKILTGSIDGSPHAFSWAAFVGIAISFFAAKYGLVLFQSAPSVAMPHQVVAETKISFTCRQPLPEFTLGETSDPSQEEIERLCNSIWAKFPDGGWEQQTSAKIRAGEDPGWRGRAFISRFGNALEECGGYKL